MPTTTTGHVAVGHLADQADHAIRLLNHRTRPASDGLADPLDTAEIIAALASMAGMLPQLLGQLVHWLEHEHHAGRLRVDALAPLPDPAQTVHALTGSLQHASQCVQRAAEELDTAHQHAAHLAAAPGPKFEQISGAKSLDETHRSAPRTRDPDRNAHRRPGRDPALPRTTQLPHPERTTHPGDLRRPRAPPAHQHRRPDRADLPAPAHPAAAPGPGPPPDLLHIPASIYSPIDAP